MAHPLIRHGFYHEPSAARRQRIHQQIAQTLQRLYADSPHAHILEIAHHLVRAGPVAAADTVVACRGSDRHRAIDLVRQASVIFHELGMEPFMRRTAQLAKALQARIPLLSRVRRAYPDNLNEREVEILLQLTQGSSAGQIADELVLAPNTVAGHVSSLFNKIGVSGRTAAAQAALESIWIIRHGDAEKREVRIRQVGESGAGSP